MNTFFHHDAPDTGPIPNRKPSDIIANCDSRATTHLLRHLPGSHCHVLLGRLLEAKEERNARKQRCGRSEINNTYLIQGSIGQGEIRQRYDLSPLFG